MLPTLQAGATQTTQAQTATSVLPSVTAPSLLTTPTPFSPSSACPPTSFDETNLDPQWAAVCSHCLDGGAAPLFPTFSFSTHTVSTQAFSTPSLLTSTPVNTPTITPTLSAPCTSPFTALQVFDNSYYLTPPATLYVGRYEYAVSAGGYTDIEIDLGGWYYIDRFDFEVYVAASTSFNTRVEVFLDSDVTPVYPSTLMGGSSGFQWKISPVFTPRYARHVRIRSQSSGSAGVFRSGQVRIRYCTSASTPTPTATVLPSATPTFGFATQPALSFGLLADCRVPVYRTEPNAQAVAFDISTDASACYRLFPEVDLQVLEFNVQIQAIDFCFQFYSVYLEVVGIVVPINLLIDASLALFLVKWGLFN